MYNAAPPYAAGQQSQSQSPYGNAGPAGLPGGGMMHGNGNGNGMPQMVPGMNGPSYQTPYSTSPYGNIPTSATHPPNFMSSNSSMNSSFPMNNPNMISQQQHQHQQQQQQQQQHPSQRMHQTSTPTQNNGLRGQSYGLQNSPPSVSQAHFSTPQNPNQTMGNHNQQQLGANTILTPQTPTFPSGAQGAVGGSMATPLSPGSEAIEKERVTLLLEINMELLMEVMRLQAMQAEAKKEEAATTSEGAVEKDKAEKERADKLKAASGKDYLECMRRLQGNLAYLAAIADRSHKPSSQIPSHPAIMTAPVLTTSSLSSPTTTTVKKEDLLLSSSSPTTADKPPLLDDPNRAESLKGQYKRLQGLFPGVDPRRDPPSQAANAQAARAKQQQMMQQQMGQGQTQGGGQQTGGGQGGGQLLDPNHAQKVQNDLLRQKMMQQQAQHQAQQQQQQMQMNAQMNAQFQMQGR